MCERIDTPDGDSILICGLRAFKKFCKCGREATSLCDWKVSARKSGTCDEPICTHHAKQVAPGKHLCPAHQLEYDHWEARRRDVAADQQPSLFVEAA